MKLVTIGIYNNPHEAYVAKSLLESCDIQTWIQDENIVGLATIMGPAFGGMKLQVKEEDYDAALEILEQAEEEAGKNISSSDDQKEHPEESDRE